jgi:hypothetical protein
MLARLEQRMSELQVTIPTPYGDVTMPWAQAEAVGKCIEKLKFKGKEATWHRANCDCCIVVHEASDEPVHHGFVIGRDGGFDWVEHTHE